MNKALLGFWGFGFLLWMIRLSSGFNLVRRALEFRV